LTAILSNHVVTGVVPSVAISNGQTIKSLGGLELTFTITDDGNGTVFMVNNATITMPNVLANNGIVHAIDMVLLKAPAQPEPSPMATPEGAPVAAPTGGAAPTKPKPPTGAVSSAMASSLSVAASVAAVLAFLV
jgi:transforming growth factor-beta-induced protein